MLMQRDKLILKHIEQYRGITIKQAQYLFFNKSYENARRRLSDLENKMGLVKSYKSNYSKEKVFILDKKISDHDLITLDYLKFLAANECEIVEVKMQPKYLKGIIRADAFVIFKKDGYKYFTILEVDYTHYTENTKFQLYEKLYRDKELEVKCEGTFPILIVARPTPGIRYNSKNFEIIYTDLNYDNLSTYLFS